MTTNLTKNLSDALLSVRRDEKSRQEVLLIRSTKLHDVVASLKNELLFDRLVDIAAVDYEGLRDLRFELNYFFSSTRCNKRLQLKLQLPDNDQPKINSICDIYPRAEAIESSLFKRSHLNNLPYHRLTPFIERLGTISPIASATGYSQAVEKLMNIDVPERAQLIRVIFCEFERCLDHMLFVGRISGELGLPVALVYALELRERFALFFEKFSGSRLGFSTIQIGGLTRDLPQTFPDEAKRLIKEIKKTTRDLKTLTEKNRLFMDRTQGEDPISRDDAVNRGLTGPNFRACGVALDLRKTETPSIYDSFTFEVPMGTKGDLFDRVSVRFEEIGQSLRIIEQGIARLKRGPYLSNDERIVLAPQESAPTDENHQERYQNFIKNGFCPEPGEIYSRTEASNGELGFFIVADGTNRPRCLKMLMPPATLPTPSSPDPTSPIPM